ncbi:methanobactin export MATE transporter MbnM [Ketogulonicigenium vulgare]|uniref:Di-haem cytochrome c peroxidase family protein n=1 Tax=Ketogulonicigenium vulgare (strain WSH-001) TaxID=759362 RepID=F9Y864_KETVW|nr:methanobactin export MATE transporter MbnM [Ketogulonicigenium vulgare]AEM42350.1 Di-haem cytochrome c peroxidase family protein [Ketogulonicigenium vulgare WSH-001]ALJ79976.1 cytochrome C peroxidase [Ketogulonicigenium vulgare]ANW32867.1 di-heme enzyme [Ketogulonicigenium vulgare]AOZ53434.1 di-heme Cytochrome-c peroxidase [Ketogulonicigenium vulgare]
MRKQLCLGFGAALAILAAVATAGANGRYIWPMPAWMPPPPVPAGNPMSAEKVDLGRHLFYDARLSRDGTVACASCHEQARAFSDGRELAVGIGQTIGIRNAPALANAGYVPQLTWANPHLTTLEAQALVPLFGEDPVEMGSNGREADIFAALAADPYYTDAFASAFPDRPVIDLFTVTRALAAFQRSLISLDSPYDRFKYGGDADAMTPAALRGERLFFDHRFECYHCHGGILFTDSQQTARNPAPMLGNHNNGLYNIGGTGAYPARATGLYEFTGLAADMGRFRTPSLRNVAVTAPYFHDGSAASLREVLDHYAAGGRTISDGPHAGIGAANPFKDGILVGFDASDAEINDLIAFLESLTDEGFLTNPAYSDPWPADHPARATRMMP